MQRLAQLGYPCQLVRTGCLSANLSALEANPAISRLPHRFSPTGNPLQAHFIVG
jgi:hypothetical protein